MTNLSKTLIFFVLSGLILRLLWAQIPGFKIDTHTWFAWSLRLNEVGFSSFYSDTIWTNYTSGFLYVLYFLGFLKNLLGIPDEVYFFILKLPAIFAEIALGIFVYKSIKKVASANTAAFLSAFVFFSPGLIFNSALWGQIDSVLTLFMFLSVYLLDKKLLILSSVSLGLAILIKPQATALLPIILFYLFKNFSFKNLLQLIFPGLVTVLFLSFPFFPNSPVLGIFDLIWKMSNDYRGISTFAYNLWGIFGFWINDQNTFLVFSYQTWGILTYLLYWAVIFLVYLKRGVSVFTLAALATLAFYFLPTRVHERYLYPALIFLIFQLVHTKNKLFTGLVLILNLLYFVGLYYVYVYYNEVYTNSTHILYIDFLYNFIDKNGALLSLAGFCIFLAINYLMINKKNVS